MSNKRNRRKAGAIKTALSPARILTYEKALGAQVPGSPVAISLYEWNAEMSAALLITLHICEVVIRNAVSEALKETYGSEWLYSDNFKNGLNRGKKRELDKVRGNNHLAVSADKAIPKLSFSFWQHMFTSRQDKKLWNNHLVAVFPNLCGDSTISQSRAAIYNDMDKLRKLRNRIAHHEPIFSRNLDDDYQKIQRLVNYRCSITADWLHEKFGPRIQHLLSSFPLP